ncbi:MAG: hypothetical protein RL130_1277 [Actinomycetota bacterium]
MHKGKEFAAVALLTGSFLGGSFTSAQADSTPSPSPSASIDSYKSVQEQFKRERDEYMQAMRERDLKMRIINMTFKNAVDKASADARFAMLNAVTPEQKNSIATARRNAIAQAITLRDSAILALGPMPTPPAKPDKFAHEKGELKVESKMDQKGRSKR